MHDAEHSKNEGRMGDGELKVGAEVGFEEDENRLRKRQRMCAVLPEPAAANEWWRGTELEALFAKR